MFLISRVLIFSHTNRAREKLGSVLVDYYIQSFRIKLKRCLIFISVSVAKKRSCYCLLYVFIFF